MKLYVFGQLVKDASRGQRYGITIADNAEKAIEHIKQADEESDQVDSVYFPVAEESLKKDLIIFV